ncbi:hypothetical protein BN14_00947 [Rhizoctonia solani AG-1 IB]|uniref:Uncharacterized protein n=1 Tax=Thanatephorus cucumeris (strain AG1-IB / isolate 7/3/14) TaxID=1108050 RepID=M5BL44_THACB|nr:hypothetical protein BN14_00947 [Rhizoctonia solani AG-1 IB]
MDSYTLLALTPDEKALALTVPASASGSPQVDITYSELRSLVLELRTLLRNEGVAGGDIVAMSLVNSLEFVVGFLATGAARFIRSCSSALAPATLERLEKTFRAPVLEAYAMTEASHQMCSNTFESRIPGTVGVGVGVEVSIRDESGKEVERGQIGEVCVKGANVTKGYWHNEKANNESFWNGRWFRTGDQGMILPEPSAPHLKLTGRIKELINRGGEKIAPPEVDAALLSIPGVHEAVAFGVPDQKYGEIVWAAVVVDSGNKGAGKEEGERIRRALQGKISKFKIPTRIIITDAIPKTATGKVQRRHVRDAFMKSVEAKAKL